MSITVPTNIPTGDRQTTPVQVPPAAASPASVRDPLSDYASTFTWPVSVEAAAKLARAEVDRCAGMSIHNAGDMISAAVGLDNAVRRLLTALGGAA
ncbi:hypothetical protein EAO71_35705 [Streptomyces sp. ms191]|uniref:hypothetical protein n=1 Tax=Streptomyces sp. ms191 TaxID=1827978 RepID=UPI0011CEB21B|nr:hypothetical protein [Streptomyces sp. ms191]TXS13384.1 hypothetical protein EAO71_35705 [Streptomyces sp. ms191]